MKAKQRGLSLIGLLIVGAVMGFALLLAFRTVPAVAEYFAIEKVIKQVAEEGRRGASLSEMRASFDRRGQIDDIVTIRGTDLRIAKKASDVLVEAEYSRKVPVAANVSLVIDFHASSAAQ